MLPQTHLMIHLIIAAALIKLPSITPSFIMIFIAWGILIDIDHLIYFPIKYRTIDPRVLIPIMKSHLKKMQAKLYIFHSPEFLVISGITSFFIPFLFPIFLATFVHMASDAAAHWYKRRNLAWMKRWSIIWTIKRRAGGE